MKKVKILMVFMPLILIATLLLGQIVLAATNPTISRIVISGGGGTVTDGNLYKITTVVGEPIAGNSITGGAYKVGSGYLGGSTVAGNSKIYLPIIIK